MVALTLGQWLRDWGLDGLFSSLAAGGIGAFVVLVAVRSDERQWHMDRLARDLSDARAAVDGLRDEVGAMYLFADSLMGRVLRTRNVERRSEIAELSGRLLMLQLHAQRAWPPAEPEIARLQMLADQALARLEDASRTAATREPEELSQIKDGLLDLLRSSIGWRISPC